MVYSKRKKSSYKQQVKRISKFTRRTIGMRPSPQIPNPIQQEQSVKVRANVRGRSYEVKISEEILRRAWREIMIEEEE